MFGGAREASPFVMSLRLSHRGRLGRMAGNHRRERTKMANTPSAKKATRKIERRTEVNKNRRSRVRTFLRKVEEAIAAGDKDAATAAFKAAEPELMRAVSRGVWHKNTASRKVSRLAGRVKAINAA